VGLKINFTRKISHAGEYLKSLGEDALGNIYPGSTIGGVKTHGHHIVMQEGLSVEAKAYVAESQAILEQPGVGIDPFKGVENMVWAPDIEYLRSTEYAKKVLELLKAVKGKGKQAIVDKLKEIGTLASKGKKLK
jgi:hypothetical protein